MQAKHVPIFTTSLQVSTSMATTTSPMSICVRWRVGSKSVLVFRYTSRPYADQEALIKDLNRDVAYQKTTDFFIKCKGLHSYFERNGGSIEKALANANRSMDEIVAGDKDYTYSELGRLIERLGSI